MITNDFRRIFSRGPDVRLAALFILIIIYFGPLVEASKDSTNTIPAEEILSQIRNNIPVAFDGRAIKGDMILSKQNFNAIGSSINLRNCSIDGNVGFNDTLFLKQVNFVNVSFNGEGNFSGSRFSNDANFSASKFMGNALFQGSKFFESTNLNDSRYYGITQFDGTEFKKDAHFIRCEFEKEAYFNGAQFKGSSYFSKAEFRNISEFNQAKFYGYTECKKTLFNKTSYFINASFYNHTIFEGTNYSDVTFEFSEFIENASFSGSKFKGNVSFHGAKFFESTNLNNSQYSGDAQFDAEFFKKDADFSQSKFGKRAYFCGQFNGSTCLSKVEFVDICDIIGAQFKDVDFRNAIFCKINFNNVNFSGEAIFSNSKFKGERNNFEFSDFRGNTSFASSVFDGHVILNTTKFYKGVNFFNCTFNSTIFKKAQFHDIATFEKCTFKKPANFEKCNFRKNTNYRAARFLEKVDFSGSEFKRAEFMLARFDGQVNGWNAIKKSDFDPIDYISLLDNLRNNGQLEEANSCYYEYKLYIKNNKFKTIFDSGAKVINDLEYSAFEDFKIDFVVFLSDFFNYILDYIHFIFGFGVSIKRIIESLLIIWILFAFGYFIIILRSISIWRLNAKVFIAILRRQEVKRTHLSLHNFLIQLKAEVNERFNKKMLQMLLDVLLFSLMLLLSIPMELFPKKEKIFNKYIKRISPLPIVERIIGWIFLLSLISAFRGSMI